jgi:SET domain-containing protein
LKSRSAAYNHEALSLRTVTKNNVKQKGLFTAKKLRKGEVVLIFAGKVVTADEVEMYPAHVMHLTVQVHYNLFQAPDLSVDSLQISDYINHSCGANCAMLDSTIMVK